MRWLSHCAYCGEFTGSNEHIDHIVPLAQGGSNHFLNLCFSCKTCNLKKGKKSKQPGRSSIIGNIIALVYWSGIADRFFK